MKNKFLIYSGLLIGTILGFAASSFAQAVTAVAPAVAAVVPTPFISAGNTAWMIMATALVMLMTIPGLALFYGGLVRNKNILNVLMQCFILLAVITLEWVIFGYSNAFGSSTGFLAPYIGGFDWAFLKGIKVTDVSPYYISQATERIPHIIFIMFQCMFAVITPALIIGAYAERMKFRGFLVFSLLWSILVYNPVAHWVWSADGWLFKLGALDFAGGTVVHINAGIAALVTAIMLGKRKLPKGQHITPPHNIPFVVIGAALLWFGWFGFNAGSALAANDLAANAFVATHVATAAAGLTWALIEWQQHGAPTVLGVSTGAVAGLVAITPACGFVNPMNAILIGMLVSLFCYIAIAYIKGKLGYDDALDVFGVHGVGGMWGTIATGIFAEKAVNAAGADGLFLGGTHQFLVQCMLILVVPVFAGVVTWILFKVVDALMGMRVEKKDEIVGLDLTQQSEAAYTVIE